MHYNELAPYMCGLFDATIRISIKETQNLILVYWGINFVN